jgi:hypothetical protein
MRQIEQALQPQTLVNLPAGALGDGVQSATVSEGNGV